MLKTERLMTSEAFQICTDKQNRIGFATYKCLVSFLFSKIDIILTLIVYRDYYWQSHAAKEITENGLARIKYFRSYLIRKLASVCCF